MTANEVLKLVADSHEVAVADLRKAGWPDKRVSDAKKHAIDELRAMGLSFPRIGRLMGGMHHTSVMYQWRRPAHSSKKLAPSQAQRIATLEAQVRELRELVTKLADRSKVAIAGERVS